MDNRVFKYKYWNTNGIGIAIVAVKGTNNDVGAYIGASEAGAQSSDAAISWTIHMGSKLYREEAFGMLLGLEDDLILAGLHYRD